MKKSQYLHYMKIFLIVCGIAILIYKVFPIVYFINDDIAMREIAAGTYTGTPDGHLIFIKYVLGVILSKFYIKIPGIDWYGIFMYGVHFLCLMLVLSRLTLCLRKYSRYIILCIGIVLFFCMDFSNIVATFQFTTNAAVCAGTALFLFLTLPRKETKRQFLIHASAIAFLVVLSFSIRSKVLLMFVPYALIFWILKIISEPDNRVRYFLFVSVIILLLGGILIVEKSAYSSKEWTDYKAFNKARAQILDYYNYPEYDTYEADYQKIGISREEYDLLYAGTLNVSSNVTIEKYIKVSELSKKIYENNHTFEERIKDAVENTVYYSFYGLYSAKSMIVLLGYLGICIYFALIKDKKNLLVMGALLIIRTVIFFCLFYQGRFPDRIFESILLGDYFVIWAGGVLIFTKYSDIFEDKCNNNIFLRILCTVVILMTGILFYSAYHKPFENYKNNEMILRDYCNSHTENRYIKDITGMTSEKEYFLIRQNQEIVNYTTVYGWRTNSELYLRKNDAMGITNIEQALLEDNVFMIETSSNMGYDLINPIINYYKSIGLEVGYEVVDHVLTNTEQYQVIKFYRK